MSGCAASMECWKSLLYVPDWKHTMERVFYWKKKNKNKNYKNIFVGRTETWSSTWKNYIASSSSPSRAQQLLLCPPRTHSFPLLGEISKEGGGEAMWEGRKHSKWLVSHAEPPRYSGETAGLGMRGGPTASSAKCETCWQYKPLFSHTCLINITHLWGRLFLFFSWQAIVQAPLLPPLYLVFLLPAVAARSVHSYLLTLRWRTFWMKRLTTWYLLVELRDLLKKLLKEKCGFLRILLRFIVTALLSWLHCCAAVMIQFKGHWFLHLLLLLLLLGTIQPVKTDEICLMWLWKELPINAKHFPGGKVPIELNYGKCRIHWFWSFTCSWD